MKRSYKHAAMILCIGIIIVMTKNLDVCISAGREGVELCTRTLIPSLFPFMVVSSCFCLLIDPGYFHWIEKIAHIPAGSGSYFILGLLGGYPSGAQLIGNGYQAGLLDKNAAEHLLTFCNNAGPAFIIGMAGVLFDNSQIGWIIWGIHGTSAIIAANIFRTPDTYIIHTQSEIQLSIPVVLKKCVISMSLICGWVILFRTLLSIIKSYICVAASDWIIPLLAGLLELSNGISSLETINIQAYRFVLFCTLLGFGGISVMLQTASVIGCLSIRNFVQGKILHCALSLLICLPFSYLLFERGGSVSFTLCSAVISIFLIILISILNKQKKCCNISNKERKGSQNKEFGYAVSKKDCAVL